MTFLLFLTAYVFLVLFLLIGFLKLVKPQTTATIKKISVVIAARNEEKHLPELLSALTRQNYPDDAYEVIVINDRSTDATKDILEQFALKHNNFRVINIVKENPVIVGKKNAINEGIKAADYPLLAFTDADCIPGINWLAEINRHFRNDIDFLVGYSPLIVVQSKFLSMLKNLERAIYFSLAAGSFGWKWGVTCTARNMAYRKDLFLKVNGFSGISHIPSGDDDLLMQKMIPFVRKMTFMLTPESVVPSYDKTKYSDQLELETRRASKFRYHPTSVQLLSVFILLFFLLQLSLSVELITGIISLKFFFILIGLKTLIDFFLLQFFLFRLKSEKLLLMLPLYETIYPLFYIFISIKGTLGKYKWKR